MKQVMVFKGNWKENPYIIEFFTLLARVGVKHELLFNNDTGNTTFLINVEDFDTHKQSIKDNIREMFYMVKFIDKKLMGQIVIPPNVEEAA